ncbi:MAG: DUF262 domain-containing protein [Planctomycetes bacterium]|nr:DUF262 domain-containing protein [Planctomycetota bacterium]
MKATATPLIGMFKGPKQFLIPIYQRAYKWTEEQCAQLWDDVVRAAQDDNYPAHFIGSVVYIERGLYQATGVPQLLVIDGQQRLTTVSLMIEALARVLDKQEPSASNELTARRVRSYCLLNQEEDGDLRYKLQLSRGDVETYRALLDGKALPENPARHLVDNFEYFQEKMEDTDVPPHVLYNGISKLLVVDVALDRDHDNPQLIFESLNSTGLDLSQSDLIRNFVLMGLEPKQQEELYKDHWRPIERTLGRTEEDDTFDRFLRAWLTMRLGEVPSLRRGYETFKRYRMMNPDLLIAELVKDLHKCADHYACIALGQESHPLLAKVFAGLQAIRVDAPMPFLLHAYSLWKSGTLSDEDMVEIARLMESWLFRRAVCDIPSNVLSRTFATIRTHLDEENLLESLAAYLILRAGRQRFPRDEEFRTALAGRNLYDFKHSQYCLTRLENEGSKEPIQIGNYQVEHVLPQNENLSQEWQTMLGPDWMNVQEHWLHTLGNLTLTGYNPELSDRPFLEKRDMKGGFAASPFHLNSSLAQATTWNEAAIKSRAAQLTQRATKVWPAPNLAPGIVATYKKEKAPTLHTPKENLSHFNMSKLSEDLYAKLLEATSTRSLTPTIWLHFIGIGKPGAGKPYPLIVRPRKNWLRLQFPLEHTDLTNPPTCTYPHKSWPHRTCANIKTAEELAECLELLQFIPGLTVDNGWDAQGEPEEDDS